MILGLRTELDLFFDSAPGSNFMRVLYAPSGVQITLKDNRESSWRRMSVMRTGERGRYWQIIIAGMGVTNLGIRTTSPTFGQVMDAVVDILVLGGKRHRIVALQPNRK